MKNVLNDGDLNKSIKIKQKAAFNLLPTFQLQFPRKLTGYISTCSSSSDKEIL